MHVPPRKLLPLVSMKSLITVVRAWPTLAAPFRALGRPEGARRPTGFARGTHVPLVQQIHPDGIPHQVSFLYPLSELVASENHSSFTSQLPKSLTAFILQTLFLYEIEAAYALFSKIPCDSTLIVLLGLFFFFFASFRTAIYRQIKLV